MWGWWTGGLGNTGMEDEGGNGPMIDKERGADREDGEQTKNTPQSSLTGYSDTHSIPQSVAYNQPVYVQKAPMSCGWGSICGRWSA
jgi:hypothetical protein